MMQNGSGRSALLAWRRGATALRGNSSRSRRAPALGAANIQQQWRLFSATSSVCARAAAATAPSSEPKPTAFPAADVSNESSDSSSLELLEKSLTLQDPVLALQHFDSLQVPPSSVIAQRLAILLAKKGGEAAQIARAQEVLKSVYMLPALKADDFTKLASIYVVDACLRHKMVDQAVEIYEEALNAGVVLDLPAYDALLRGLTDVGQVDDAVTILKEIVAQNDVSPTEQTYAPLLMSLMERFDYSELIDLIDHGRSHGIAFTLDTYDPLVDLGEEQGDDPDCIDGLEKFMLYVNNALEEDGLMTDFDGDDIEIEFEERDDDDDGDDNNDFDDHQHDDDDEFN